MIRWRRVFGVLFAIALLVLFLRGGISLGGAFEGLGEIGSEQREKGPVERVATLGLLSITIVAIVKLLLQRPGK